ncbi:hypothetical protein [Xanthomonas euvesicatoria]|uniref:hypothetical protein n=1 Tax=Xanthomonas euvesicatoria TaxID=456327 RepID=UPI001E38D04B|nr:hypothetical protein [Xanthomonas euvesicatoria]
MLSYTTHLQIASISLPKSALTDLRVPYRVTRHDNRLFLSHRGIKGKSSTQLAEMATNFNNHPFLAVRADRHVDFDGDLEWRSVRGRPYFTTDPWPCLSPGFASA